MTRSMGRSLVRSLVRLICATALAGGFLVAAPGAARACSCAELDLAHSLPEADGAFVGTYLGRDSIGDYRFAVTFHVERVVKGEFGPSAIVRTNDIGGPCGIEPLDGRRMGLLLDRAEDGVWESSLCHQVAPDQLLPFASESHPPDPAIAPVGVGWTSSIKLLIAGVVAVGALFLLRWYGRRSISSARTGVT